MKKEKYSGIELTTFIPNEVVKSVEPIKIDYKVAFRKTSAYPEGAGRFY